MVTIEGLTKTLNDARKRSNYLSNVVVENNVLINKLRDEIGSKYYGIPGNTIYIIYNKEKQAAKILRFELYAWQDIPSCICELSINGRIFEYCLAGGRDER